MGRRQRLLVATAAFAAVAVIAFAFHHRLAQFVRGPATSPVIKLPRDPHWTGDAYLTIAGFGIERAADGYYLLETQPHVYLLVRSSDPLTVHGAGMADVTGMFRAIDDDSRDANVFAEARRGADLLPFILDANDPFRGLRISLGIAAALFLFGTWHLVRALARPR